MFKKLAAGHQYQGADVLCWHRQCGRFASGCPRSSGNVYFRIISLQGQYGHVSICFSMFQRGDGDDLE